MVSEPVLVVAKLARVFDELGIRYVVGGSLASSLYGTPRATLDVDLVAEISRTQADAVGRALGTEFHVDPALIREAVEQHSSFNALYLATMFKADIFVAGGDPWSREELARGRLERFETSEGTASIRFASPEDTVLHKLVWYKLGNEVSDRQWRDVVGMLKIQGDALDQTYLDCWAPSLGVADVLARARQEATR
jgi:hypothetical protein